jgi:hypothetical protein
MRGEQQNLTVAMYMLLIALLFIVIAKVLL